MKSIFLTLFYAAARRYFGREFFDAVEDLVVKLIDEDLGGDEKREKVRQFAREQWNLARMAAVDTIIQLVLLKRGEV